jgi:hypothetical protein
MPRTTTSRCSMRCSKITAARPSRSVRATAVVAGAKGPDAAFRPGGSDTSVAEASNEPVTVSPTLSGSLPLLRADTGRSIPSSALDSQGVASPRTQIDGDVRVGQNEAARSAPVLELRVAALLPDPFLHVLDHELKLFSRARRCQLVHRHAAIPSRANLGLRWPAEAAISQPRVSLHPHLRPLVLVTRDTEHVLDHLLAIAGLLADPAHEAFGPAAGVARDAFGERPTDRATLSVWHIPNML